MFELQLYPILVTTILDKKISVGQKLLKTRDSTSCRNDSILEFSRAMQEMLE